MGGKPSRHHPYSIKMPKRREIKTGFEHLKGLTIGDVRKITKSHGIDPDKAAKNMLDKIKKRK